MLFSSNPHGNNEEGWNRGRYGAFYDLETWYISAAGFVELIHYYRLTGLPRESSSHGCRACGCAQPGSAARNDLYNRKSIQGHDALLIFTKVELFSLKMVQKTGQVNPVPVVIPVHSYMEKDLYKKSHWFIVPEGEIIQGLVARSGDDRRVYVVTVGTPPEFSYIHDRRPHLVKLEGVAL